MADVTIGELPSLNTMEADTLIPVEHDGTAKSMSGTVLGNYVYGLVEDDVEIIARIIAVGPKGDDGVSPTLSSSKVGKTTTVYYTDAEHTTPTVLATLQDGQDGSGTGDMLKATYDQDDDGVVDDSERLGGQLPSYYMQASQKGAANGVASLDETGLIIGSQASARFGGGGTASRMLSNDDNGKMILCYNSNVVITIPGSTLTPYFEVEIIRWEDYSVTIQAADGVSLNGVNGGSKTIQNRYRSAVLKQINRANNTWLIQGDIA